MKAICASQQLVNKPVSPVGAQNEAPFPHFSSVLNEAVQMVT